MNRSTALLVAIIVILSSTLILFGAANDIMDKTIATYQVVYYSGDTVNLEGYSNCYASSELSFYGEFQVQCFKPSDRMLRPSLVVMVVSLTRIK